VEKDLVIAEQRKAIAALEQKVTRLQAHSDNHDSKLRSIMDDMERREVEVDARFNALSEAFANARCRCGEDKENVPPMSSSDESSYVPAPRTSGEPFEEVVGARFLVMFEMTNTGSGLGSTDSVY
jgi:uncharacterized coiled-coil protein SlyX